jgi:nitrile hydratase
MNGAQDLGGMMGFGPVKPEAESDIFHAAWEKKAFALTLAMGSLGRWNIDEARHARETLHPVDYLQSPYYDIWIKALAKLMLREGLVTEAELSSGHSIAPRLPVTAVPPDRIVAMMASGTQYDRPSDKVPMFSVGDTVMTRNEHPSGHTRLPRYARAKRGVIERIIGFFVFPDSAAKGEGDRPQWLYTVTFEGQALWGTSADPTSSVSIDAWESYLERI